jgi:hypothetical protein
VDDAASARRKELEQGFRRSGLPLFVEGFSASTDVFNRVVPLLALVFAGELLGALNLDWSPLGNIAAVAGAIGLTVVVMGGLNLARGRPFFALPRTVGTVDLAIFVLVPAVLPLIFGGQWRSAMVTAVANLVLLGLIYATFGYGLPSILRWTGLRLFSQLRASLALLTRAIPLLMIFSVVLFLTTEMWQVFAEASTVALAGMTLLFVALGCAFLVARLPKEVRALERDSDIDAPPLERRQRLNVGLVMFVSQALQVLFVSLAIGIFFAALGLLLIDADLTKQWTGKAPDVLFDVHMFGRRGIVTAELLRVSGAIAAFTGLYFGISMLTDDVYRREFVDELTSEMRSSFEARAEYLRLRRA